MRDAAGAIRADPVSVQRLARFAGLLYLVIIGLGLFGEIVIRHSLIVPGDAGATAGRILAAESLWRSGVSAQLVLLLCALALSWTWYILLRPVSKRLTLLAMFFALVSLAVESVSALHLQAVLAPLKIAEFGQAADQHSFHVLAYLSAVAHGHAFAVALLFFGVECLIIGHLVRRSGYFPRMVGTLMQVAGLCYVINTMAMIQFPDVHGQITPAILLPCLVGESVFCLWLLIKGVNLPAWERAHSLQH